MMPRPVLPRAKDIADIARLLRAEGFSSICIATSSDGKVSITVGASEDKTIVTPLEQWKATRDAA